MIGHFSQRDKKKSSYIHSSSKLYAQSLMRKWGSIIGHLSINCDLTWTASASNCQRNTSYVIHSFLFNQVISSLTGINIWKPAFIVWKKMSTVLKWLINNYKSLHSLLSNHLTVQRIWNCCTTNWTMPCSMLLNLYPVKHKKFKHVPCINSFYLNGLFKN